MGVGNVVSEVKGVHIEINTKSLGCMLHMPTIGSISEDLMKCENDLKVILEHEDVEGFKEVRANMLGVEMRLLDHIINGKI